MNKPGMNQRYQRKPLSHLIHPAKTTVVKK